MLLLNFGHPLTPEIISEIESKTGQIVADQRHCPVQLNLASPFSDQVAELVRKVGLSSEEWQTKPILINPPSLNLIALTLLAELHGRMGYFPSVIRLKPNTGALSGQFEFAEIVNLQAIRDTARSSR
jgi:hypothetical protein